VKLKIFALVLALSLLAVSALARAQSAGACVNVQTAGVAARFAGLDLQASAAGKGIYVFQIQATTISTIFGRISSAAVLDADLATITPTMVFGRSALTTVIREGTAAAAGAEGDLLVINIQQNWPTMFVPPGKFLTLWHVTANTAVSSTVCFYEAL